jgi:hypothetical protein
MQDELREEAKDLMTFVLEKNSEVEARSVRSAFTSHHHITNQKKTSSP